MSLRAGHGEVGAGMGTGQASALRIWSWTSNRRGQRKGSTCHMWTAKTPGECAEAFQRLFIHRCLGNQSKSLPSMSWVRGAGFKGLFSSHRSHQHYFHESCRKPKCQTSVAKWGIQLIVIEALFTMIFRYFLWQLKLHKQVKCHLLSQAN